MYITYTHMHIHKQLHSVLFLSRTMIKNSVTRKLGNTMRNSRKLTELTLLMDKRPCVGQSDKKGESWRQGHRWLLPAHAVLDVSEIMQSMAWAVFIQFIKYWRRKNPEPLGPDLMPRKAELHRMTPIFQKSIRKYLQLNISSPGCRWRGAGMRYLKNKVTRHSLRRLSLPSYKHPFTWLLYFPLNPASQWTRTPTPSLGASGTASSFKQISRIRWRICGPENTPCSCKTPKPRTNCRPVSTKAPD